MVAGGAQAAGPNFNPLFPYGKRRPTDAVLEELQKISIHSSHTGRDTEATRQALAEGFQSTLPIREETWRGMPRLPPWAHFNPLFPYGKRPALKLQSKATELFQSTLPIREETL